MSKIKISAFPWVPPFAQGLVRDHRLRWALEEIDLPYEVRLISRTDQNAPFYRQMQPFGQVPVYEEGDLVMFESGAILLHIAEKDERLMPRDAVARARTMSWMFAALNSIEPHIMHLATIDFFQAGEEWAKLRRPSAIDFLKTRLQSLANWLEGREYLEDQFTVADLLMTTVLRIPRHTDLIAKIPVLESYRLRCEARPAFRKSLADQMSTFEKNQPPTRP